MPPLRRVHLPQKQNRPVRGGGTKCGLRRTTTLTIADSTQENPPVKRDPSTTTDGHGCTVRQGSLRPTQTGRNVTPTSKEGSRPGPEQSADCADGADSGPFRRCRLATANWSLRTRGEAVAVSREVHLGVSPVVCRLVSRAASLPTSAPESRPESRPRPCVLSGAEPRAVSEVAPRAVPQAEPVVAPFVIGREESIVVCFGISSAPSQAPAPGAAPGPPTPRENCGSSA